MPHPQSDFPGRQRRECARGTDMIAPPQPTNFGQLRAHDEQLLRLGLLAEKYFPEDPNTSLLKLRQFAELLAQLTASRLGQFTSTEESQYDLLRRLQDGGYLPREVAQLFGEVRRTGNAANHALADDHRSALATLKLCWQLGIWFHRTFKDQAFKSGPFQPPTPPVDESADLRAELQRLQSLVAEHQQNSHESTQRLEFTDAKLREVPYEQRVDACRERLNRVPALLKRFRQSVLAAATSGVLTADWREEHPRAEPGEALLKQIANERQRQGLPSAFREIKPEGIEIPDDELLVGWAWCRVGQLADVKLGGTPSRAEPAYWRGEVPWVSSGEVANCRIAATGEAITALGLRESNAKLYPVGTVLIAMIGEGKTRGQSAILDVDAATNQNVAGLVFDGGAVDSEYVWLWALGEYERTRSVGRGGNQPALNGAKVRALPVPLPPADEQREIVSRVRRLFAFADRLEASYAAARTHTERITPALLAKAFRGELVPQDPNDEPAGVLLERIRTNRAVDASHGAARRGRM